MIGRASPVLGVATLLGACLLAFGQVQAQIIRVPVPGQVDPRVRTVFYREDSVVALRGHYGYQTTIEFGSDERIENVSIGDSIAWQVTPNQRADTLFIKPIELDAATNMSVITSKRRYSFQLTAAKASDPGDPEILYRVKFLYPKEPPPPPPPATVLPQVVRNANYTISGDTRAIPSRIYDDGTSTYFEWPNGVATPAVFAVSGDGQESVVNFIMRGQTMVVERVSPGFILRNGGQETFVSNDGWLEPVAGPDAPKIREDVRKKPKRRLWFAPRARKEGQS
jgi:type IV secretion system protein VirB9